MNSNWMVLSMEWFMKHTSSASLRSGNLIFIGVDIIAHVCHGSDFGGYWVSNKLHLPQL
jgi:hypothetical protein